MTCLAASSSFMLKGLESWGEARASRHHRWFVGSPRLLAPGAHAASNQEVGNEADGHQDQRNGDGGASGHEPLGQRKASQNTQHEGRNDDDNGGTIHDTLLEPEASVPQVNPGSEASAWVTGFRAGEGSRADDLSGNAARRRSVGRPLVDRRALPAIALDELRYRLPGVGLASAR
jgi:hypothetical protein